MGNYSRPQAGPAFHCAGCGVLLGAEYPFRCPGARDGDDIDHVVVPVVYLDEDDRWPPRQPPRVGLPTFDRYRRLLSAWKLAVAGGLSDEEYLRLSADLDHAIARLDGRGFAVTPFASRPSLAGRLGFEGDGELWVKDETGNVSGSHKGRHLAGVMLYLLVAERLGLPIRVDAEGGARRAGGERSPLAIASCGNAALAAAVVARAASWPLTVFVPPSAHAAVVERLAALDARIVTCHREPGVRGDPCYLAFKQALGEGSLPFCCQGSDNGLTIQGGQTIAWEMAEAIQAEARDRRSLDAVFVQVGGGALASAVIQGLENARALGVIERMPRIYAVQTAGGFPLARASEAVAARARRTDADEALAYARQHRSEFMWPWEEEPRSIAHGILDDETYDWAAVTDGVMRTSGRVVVVQESRLEEANQLGRSLTGIDVDHTGTAGLAGLMDVLEQEPSLRRARVAVIFSGVRRSK